MGIRFFKKNIIDLDNTLPTITVTDSVATNTGEDFTDLMRNRNNTSGWMTTDSADAGTTTMVVTLNDAREMDSIILVKHNLKAFTLKYWNGSSYVDFSTPIVETTNTDTTNIYEFTLVEVERLQLIITATQVADADKSICQFICTEAVGAFTEEPEVKPMFDKDRKTTKFLSGKNYVAKSVGGFNCRLTKSAVSTSADQDLIETLFDSFEGFLVWICGGTTNQFTTIRQGYRLEDIFLMACANEYEPEFNDSRWKHGVSMDLKLVEVN